MVESTFTRRRLEAIVGEALRAADALGVLPTPLDALGPAAGVRAVAPIESLPPGVAASRGSVLGALWFAERTIYVDGGLSEPRRRFTEAHELMHALCPWHEAVLRLDTEDELFRPVRDAIEAEANLGASLLIFQGREFAARAGSDPPTVERARALAREHGASLHATLRHLVETHRHSAAMLAVGRFPLRDGSLPVWHYAPSSAFAARFGPTLPPLLSPATPLHELAEASRAAGYATTTIRLPDRSGRATACTAESYYNRHALLIVISAAGTAARRAA